MLQTSSSNIVIISCLSIHNVAPHVPCSLIGNMVNICQHVSSAVPLILWKLYVHGCPLSVIVSWTVDLPHLPISLILQSVSALLDLPRPETTACAIKPRTVRSVLVLRVQGHVVRTPLPSGVQSIRELEFKWQSIPCCSVRRGWPCASHSVRGDVVAQLSRAFERHGVFWCVPAHRQRFHPSGRNLCMGRVASDRPLAFRLRSASTIAVWCFVPRGQSNTLFPWHCERHRPISLPHFGSWSGSASSLGACGTDTAGQGCYLPLRPSSCPDLKDPGRPLEGQRIL